LTAKANHTIYQGYIDYLNTLLNQIITDNRLKIINPSKPTSLVACYQNESITPLKLKSKGWLHFSQQTCIKGGRVVVEYSRYVYSTSKDPDKEDAWIFRYEYSLNPEPKVPHAHLHVNATRNEKTIKHIHFPTSRVSIEQIIAHLIIEYGVKPKKRDWFNQLAESHKGFIDRRTDKAANLFP
jgi:hypothetical protein